MSYYAAGGYYGAGGLGSFFKKAARAVTAVAGSSIGQAALGFVPGGSSIMTGLKVLKQVRGAIGGGPGAAAAVANSLGGPPVVAGYRYARSRRRRRRRY